METILQIVQTEFYNFVCVVIGATITWFAASYYWERKYWNYDPPWNSVLVCPSSHVYLIVAFTAETDLFYDGKGLTDDIGQAVFMDVQWEAEEALDDLAMVGITSAIWIQIPWVHAEEDEVSLDYEEDELGILELLEGEELH